MLEFAVFVYGLLAGFTLLVAERNQREARPNPAMVYAIGWTLMSMSSVLAVLLLALGLAAAMGGYGPIIEALG